MIDNFKIIEATSDNEREDYYKLVELFNQTIGVINILCSETNPKAVKTESGNYLVSREEVYTLVKAIFQYVDQAYHVSDATADTPNLGDAWNIYLLLSSIGSLYGDSIIRQPTTEVSDNESSNT